MLRRRNEGAGVHGAYVFESRVLSDIKSRAEEHDLVAEDFVVKMPALRFDSVHDDFMDASSRIHPPGGIMAHV
jgi:hypothetical protein